MDAVLSGAGPGADDAGTNHAGDTFQHDKAPSGARVHAQQQEEARVTLFRALKTTLRLLDARGYDMVKVGTCAVSSFDDARLKIQKYNTPGRASAAETAHEIILTARTNQLRPFTTAAAQALPFHTIAVFVVDQGKVSTMREIQDAMRLCDFQMAIILSRKALTPVSKRFLLTPAVGALAPIQHFTYADMQAAIVDHELVPLHVPLNAAESARVRERFQSAKLSILLAQDPVSRFLGFTPGMIIMIRETWGRDQGGVTFFEVNDVM